jgi:hypothetical protein
MHNHIILILYIEIIRTSIIDERHWIIRMTGKVVGNVKRKGKRNITIY